MSSYKEIRRSHPDSPMRRFKIDCRWCHGAGAGCPRCGDRGTEIVEIDEDEIYVEDELQGDTPTHEKEAGR